MLIMSLNNPNPFCSLPFVLACLAFAVGCNDDTNAETTDTKLITVVDHSQYAAYHSIQQNDFSIEDGEIIKDILELKISFLGGCREHEFSLYAGNGIAKSNPPQGVFLLIHNTRDDTCAIETREVLFFDLSPYREYLQSSGLLDAGTIVVSINSGLYCYQHNGFR